LDPAEHPLLGAAVELAGRDEWLLSGRLSLETHPWLADHAVLDTVLVPGTAFVELALAAGAKAGCPAVEELTLEAPLVLEEQGSVQLQLTLAAAAQDGRRALAIHARAGGAEDWTRHASGTLAAQADSAPALEALSEGLGPGRLRLRFAVRGVRVQRPGAASVRVRLLASAADGTLEVATYDEDGAPILTLDTLVTRPVDAGRLADARAGRG